MVAPECCHTVVHVVPFVLTLNDALSYVELSTPSSRQKLTFTLLYPRQSNAVEVRLYAGMLFA